MGERFLAELNDMLAIETDNSIRVRLVEQLGSYKYNQALPYIRQALDDNDSQVRRAACWAAGYFQDKQSIPKLLERLDDSNSSVRASAKMSLAKLGEESRIKIFEYDMYSDDPLLASSSYRALAKLGKTNILTILLQEAVEPDIVSMKRIAAVRALQELKPSISKIIKEGLDEMELLYNVSLVDNLQFDYKIDNKDLTSIFIEALKDAGNSLHRDAPSALTAIQDSKAIPYLRNALFQGDDIDFIAAVAQALGDFRDKEAVESLIKILDKYGT